MTSSASVQPLSPFSPGSDAGAPGGWAGVTRGRGGGAVIKPALSPAVGPAIDAAVLRALGLARAAGETGEVPMDAVVLSPGEMVLAEAANTREVEHDPTAHAEIRALRAAGTALDDSHLDGCALVVTPEPCTMYVGVIVLARVTRLILGAWKPRTRACGSVRDAMYDTRASHQVEVRAGLRVQKSQELLTAFFADRR